MWPKHFGQERVDDNVHGDLGGVYLEAVVLADLRRCEEDEDVLTLGVVKRLPGARSLHSEAPKMQDVYFLMAKKPQHENMQHDLLNCLPPTQRGTVVGYWDLEGLVEQSFDELLVWRRIASRQRCEPCARSRRVDNVPQWIPVTE